VLGDSLEETEAGEAVRLSKTRAFWFSIVGKWSDGQAGTICPEHQLQAANRATVDDARTRLRIRFSMADDLATGRALPRHKRDSSRLGSVHVSG
jgi:hypothetical protein